MKTGRILITVVLAVALLGCGKREARHIVILPDVSGSIDRESLEQAFKAIGDLASHLQRGDRLTIIPILGDAEAEASGKILRFEAPANRQAYDTDLRDFRIKMVSALKEMQIEALSRPGSHTDILGSIELAEQEFKVVPESKQILIILSDFIQDDSAYNWDKEQRLNTVDTAVIFSEQLAKNEAWNFDNTRVYLGLLRSNEYLHLAKNRRAALKAFWTTYFKSFGSKVQFTNDGQALLNSLM